LKSPVFGSTRASAWSAGTLSARWISTSGAAAKRMSQGFDCQKAKTATPSAASTRSVENASMPKRPVSFTEYPLARFIITASIVWFSSTKTAAAASPATAVRRFAFARICAFVIRCAAVHAPIEQSV